MKSTVSIKSEQLNKEDLRALLQTIRDCEMVNFPDKEIYILVEVPELSEDDTLDLFSSIKPPFKYGPEIFKYRTEEE